MEYLIYNSKLPKTKLESLNIVISKQSKIGKNVKIYSGCCLYGNCVIENDVVLWHNSILENATIGEGTSIKSSYVENSKIGKNCIVGPFAHIRDDSLVGDECRLGNFIEIKKSTLGKKSKMAHLSYMGDAVVGENCNIGCGVVFCNYNGKIKQQSVLGNNVFVGSNANLIAPVNIGDNVYIAGGST
ncbi:MAG: bifunctional UDP-N-acetylglucosamine diphosphorylase/glucosamine-1-phosphate N-acetyltransferase GlmU, partial [Clostridia bacterium]|nr:bifunctional UDP-N-acetylglucosamine diphosphorylase/glucosamine-1-phosphate N-acetyltransferase GlmU [Clostridia bacterium]